MNKDVSPTKRPQGPTSQFRSRKRPKKARKPVEGKSSRTSDQTSSITKGSPSEADVNPTSTADVFLLKAAQQLRDRQREVASSSMTVLTEPKSKLRTQDEDQSKANNDIAEGLHSNFSVERSGFALEERMGNFIADGMARKFGQTQVEFSQQQNCPPVEQNEADDFEIPAKLQVDEKPAYDPGEGLPASGMEEVDLPRPDMQNSKTAPDDNQHPGRPSSMRENARGDVGTSATTSGVTYGSNLSANFTRHKNLWKASNPSTRTAPNSSTAVIGNAVTSSAAEGGASIRRASTHAEEDRSANVRQAPVSGSKRRNQASDAAFADRFRKRWRG